MDDKRPIIGITMGDPAGIGPEIIARMLGREEIYQECRPLVIGSAAIMERACKVAGIHLGLKKVREPREAGFRYGEADVLETGEYDTDKIEYGQLSALAGKMSMDFIRKSIELGMKTEINAVTTAPINKEAIKLAGVKQAGHTEIYLDGTGAEYVLTMFDCFKMRVFHLSRHISLRAAIDFATKENILLMLRRINRELRKMNMEEPVIAVAGLNPHCGEHGLFGTEEMEEIMPAVEAAQREGIRAVGPCPPDSLFAKAKTGIYDAVLALYHDQGHMPCKTLDLERSVSVTLGLPFIRCSVDHGTAFDIAGKGIASEVSMMAALRATVKYAGYRMGQ